MITKMKDFKFGIELENWCEWDTEWHLDNDDILETPSPILNSFEDLLKWSRERILWANSHEKGIILHSYPKGKRGSGSAHIHFSPSKNYDLYHNLHKLINVFQFFFKNSPKIKDSILSLSRRQTNGMWCRFNNKMSKTMYDTCCENGRHSVALTPNSGCGTMEFRYNDFPKSMAQLSMFNYLLNSSNQMLEKETKDDFEIEILQLENLNDLSKKILGGNTNLNMFSYKNPENIIKYDSDYFELIKYYANVLDEINPQTKYYDFYSDGYTSFKNLVTNGFQKESKQYKKYLDNNMEDIEWSNYWMKEWDKTVPEVLIKGGN